MRVFGGSGGKSPGRIPVSTRDLTTGGCGEARSSNGTGSAESPGSYPGTASAGQEHEDAIRADSSHHQAVTP